MAVRTIATDITLDSKQFNSQMTAVNSNLKTLKSDMKAVSAEFKNNENSTAALSAKQNILQQQYDQQKEKVRAYKEALAQVTKATGADSAATDKYRQQLNAAISTLSRMEDDLEANTKALSKSKTVYSTISNAVDQFKKKISDVKEKVADHTQILGKMGDAMGKLGGAAAKGGIAAVSATGVAAFSAAKSMISFASEAAAAAQAAADAGEQLSPVQQKWLAYSHTLTNLDESVNAAKAALGGVLLPLLGEMGEEGTQLLFQFSDAMEAAAGDPEAMGKVVTEYVAKFAAFLKDSLPEIKELARDFLTGLGEGFDENGDQILDDAMDIVSELLDGIIAAAPQIGSAAGQLISRLGTELAAQGPAVLEAGLQLLLGLLQGFAEGLPEFIESLPDMILQIVHTLIDLAPAFLDVGKQIVQGIWNGLVSAWHVLVDGVKGLFNDLLSSVRADQEIHSPSRKWGRMVGGPMAQGVGVDFKEQMKTVRKEIEAQLDPSSFPTPGKFDIPSPPPGGSGVFGGSSSVSNRTVNGGINIVVNAAPGQSAEEIAEAVKIRMQNETETETEVFT